ncbi:dihydroneopterin aldolase [Paracoccus suum]|uniref:dihydroneopterin aldolase n=1 Tax=Paracoccus suum TaxID=2259340 RepID=A0A344PKU5_9RHOB|nr:dihydroneopterin aldolase [Paracoccus suum]AXC50000.1 dihydroneopterin aldolase [Paracoccus suum]
MVPDRIHLREHVIEAEIGAFASERDRRQRLRFALTATLARPGTGASDNVDSILSYDVLVGAIADALGAKRFDLLEALAEDIAARILAHPQAAEVQVCVEKLDRVPGALGITITRARGDAAVRSVSAVKIPVLSARDSRPSGAAVIVPDAPGLPMPQGGDPVQMALLALDQAAWALAAQLGLEIAATRTEIQAAASEGRAVVWAPVRMVREAQDLPPADRDRPEALARWLAARLRDGGSAT